MATLSTIVNDILTLNKNDKKALKSIILGILNTITTLTDYVEEKRFASETACPICSSNHIIKNGHRKDGAQKYVCKECKHSFVSTVNSICYYSKKDLSVWEKYIDCMMDGLSIRKTAERCGMHRNNAFVWRHKILDALQNMANGVSLNGVVEADETFFPISYKGNHKNSEFTMPRHAHKRGHQHHLRGLSHEQVCVPCAVNGNGLSIAKITNTGRPSTKNINSLLNNRIQEDSILVTDKSSAYIKFALQNSLELVQMESGKSTNGMYHIQHINGYHSQLKRFMRPFNGVATKYLNNYLIWHNFVNYAKESFTEKKDIFLSFVLSTIKTVTKRELSIRPSLPLMAA